MISYIFSIASLYSLFFLSFYRFFLYFYLSLLHRFDFFDFQSTILFESHLRFQRSNWPWIVFSILFLQIPNVYFQDNWSFIFFLFEKHFFFSIDKRRKIVRQERRINKRVKHLWTIERERERERKVNCNQRERKKEKIQKWCWREKSVKSRKCWKRKQKTRTREKNTRKRKERV